MQKIVYSVDMLLTIIRVQTVSDYTAPLVAEFSFQTVHLWVKGKLMQDNYTMQGKKVKISTEIGIELVHVISVLKLIYKSYAITFLLGELLYRQTTENGIISVLHGRIPLDLGGCIKTVKSKPVVKG